MHGDAWGCMVSVCFLVCGSRQDELGRPCAFSPHLHQAKHQGRFLPAVTKAVTMLTSLMMAVPAFFARLTEAPDAPAVLFSREFFGRAYSTSNDGWVMTWVSLALSCVDMCMYIQCRTHLRRRAACPVAPLLYARRTPASAYCGTAGAHLRAGAPVARRRALRLPEERRREAVRAGRRVQLHQQRRPRPAPLRARLQPLDVAALHAARPRRHGARCHLGAQHRLLLLAPLDAHEAHVLGSQIPPQIQRRRRAGDARH